MSGIWRGVVPGKPFGFILTDDGRRHWCHERQVRNEEIVPESRYLQPSDTFVGYVVTLLWLLSRSSEYA